MTGKNKGSTYDEALNATPRTGGKNKCALDKLVQLQRVDPGAAKGLNKGRHLIIKLHREAAVRSVVCLRPDTGKYVGAIAYSGVATLIECLEGGQQYEGTVKTIEGAAVHVRINDI
jgi:hypothetical protein